MKSRKVVNWELLEAAMETEEFSVVVSNSFVVISKLSKVCALSSCKIHHISNYPSNFYILEGFYQHANKSTTSLDITHSIPKVLNIATHKFLVNSQCGRRSCLSHLTCLYNTISLLPSVSVPGHPSLRSLLKVVI